MQDLKLNIYKSERNKKGERIIEKTYTADTAEIMYGSIEDILGVLDLDKMNDDETMIKLIIVAMKQIKPIFKDVFYGLTDEELKRTLTNEVIDNVLSILKFVVGESSVESALKNIQGRVAK